MLTIDIAVSRDSKPCTLLRSAITKVNVHDQASNLSSVTRDTAQLLPQKNSHRRTMAALITGLPAVLQGQSVGEALSGIFGSVSLAAWICLLV